MDEYKRLVALEKRLGDTGNDLPIVVMGNRILGGNKEIDAELSGLLTKYAATGLPDIVSPQPRRRTPCCGRPRRAAGRCA